MRKINAAVLGEGWRLLERHEEIKDGDQTGCASLLMSILEHEGWRNVGDWAVGMTVEGALTGDGDAKERLFRRRMPSAEVERAATLAWNEALEDAERLFPPTTRPYSVSEIVNRIRALKRTT